MDALPPELWLKLAEACDFATVCALSKLNKSFHALISSNPKSFERHNHEKFHFTSISLENEYVRKNGHEVPTDAITIKCLCRTKDGNEKVMKAKIVRGSGGKTARDLLENGWEYMLSQELMEIRTPDAEKFLRELFTPILGKSTIHTLSLEWVKSQTVRTIGDLLERWRPAIYELELCLATKDRNVFAKAVRIVELAKPRHLVLTFGNAYTSEEICEKVLAKIANKTMTKASIHALNCFGNSEKYAYNFSERLENRRMFDALTASMRFPKCALLNWVQCKVALVLNLSVTSIVDLIEEWSCNSREIVHYNLGEFDVFQDVPNKFKEELRARKLPILIHEEAMYRIEKLDKRGDEQDELCISFPCHRSDSHEDYSVEINSRRGEAVKVDGKVEIENFEKCRYC